MKQTSGYDLPVIRSVFAFIWKKIPTERRHLSWSGINIMRYSPVRILMFPRIFCCVTAGEGAGIAQSVRGSNPGGRRDFPHPSRPVLGPTHPPVQWAPGLSRGLKRPGRGSDHPPPSSAEVKERVELYLYSPSGPQWPVIGRTFTFYLYLNRWRSFRPQLSEMRSKVS